MKSKKRLNVIDVIIIICILLIVAVSVFRAVSVRKSKGLTEEKNVLFTVTATNLDAIYADSIKDGDKVYLTDKKLMCGNVTDIKAEYMIKSETFVGENGEPVTYIGLNPSKIKLEVTINTTGHFADSMLYLGNNTYLSEGQRMVFHNETFTFEGIISNFVEQ